MVVVVVLVAMRLPLLGVCSQETSTPWTWSMVTIAVVGRVSLVVVMMMSWVGAAKVRVRGEQQQQQLRLLVLRSACLDAERQRLREMVAAAARMRSAGGTVLDGQVLRRSSACIGLALPIPMSGSQPKQVSCLQCLLFPRLLRRFVSLASKGLLPSI